MDKSIEDLIIRFENKKEFREVKLRTRESFREDQAALERRLSRRVKPRQDNGMLNGDSKTGTVSVNGLAENAEGNAHLNGLAENAEVNGSLSRLESIVLDIEREKEDEKVRNNSVDEFVVLDVKQKKSHICSFDNNGFLDEEKNHVPNGSEEGNAETSLMNNRNGSAHFPNEHENGVNGNTQNNVRRVSGQSEEVFEDPALQTIFKTSNGSTAGSSTLIMRPKITAQARAAMTPEPRLKSLKGIYQKNPKLTLASTEHLDNVSLKGFRPQGFPQGQKIEYNQVSVPPVPSAEVTSLPADGNLSTFSPEHMVTVFRLLNIPEKRVYRLHKYKVDGKRFALFSDEELQDMGMNNPIVRYFRDRSGQRQRKKPPKFML